jgi:hypothetical protein
MEGNVGIGLFPEADSPPLTLTGGGTPSVPKSPLRIEDGNQQEGRALTSSDAYGNASWQDLPAGFTLGRVYGLYGVPQGYIPYGGTNPVNTGFSFTADTAGFYAFEVRWWGKWRQAVGGSNCIHFLLYKGSNPEDEFEQYSGTNTVDLEAFTVCFTLYANAVKGNIFTLRVRVYDQILTTSNGMDTQNTPDWQLAQINIVRLN